MSAVPFNEGSQLSDAPRMHHSSRQRNQSSLNAQCRAVKHSPVGLVARLSSRSHFRGHGYTYSPRRSQPRLCSRFRLRASPHRSRSPRERSHSRTCQDVRTPPTRIPERHREYRKEARAAAFMNPAWVKTRGIVYNTCARMNPRAYSELPTMLRDESYVPPKKSMI